MSLAWQEDISLDGLTNPVGVWSDLRGEFGRRLADTLGMAAADANTARLLIACPDGQGIVAAVSGFVAEHGGNLLKSDQHTDAQHGEFFMRVEFELAGCDLNRDNFANIWSPLAQRFEMNWQVHWSEDVKRMAIMVGKQAH